MIDHEVGPPTTEQEWYDCFFFRPMTEANWLNSTTISEMLGLLRGRLSDRKTRRFALACCHRQWSFFTDPRCRHGVELAERIADNRVPASDVLAAFRAVEDAFNESAQESFPERWAGLSPSSCAALAARSVLSINPVWAYDKSALIVASEGEKLEAEYACQAHLLRDIVGNPFRPVRLDPVWVSSTVRAVARSIYKEKTFDHLPTLADALEDAGCSSQDILKHCREPGVHVRGCWALDLVLGKE
jgi:hypothetical protein